MLVKYLACQKATEEIEAGRVKKILRQREKEAKAKAKAEADAAENLRRKPFY